MNLLYILLFFIECHCVLQKRLRRQAVSSNYIKIKSVDSKVAIDEYINVLSMASEIRLIKKRFNGTFWSKNSKMQFDEQDTFLNATFDSLNYYWNMSECQSTYGNSRESLILFSNPREAGDNIFLSVSLYDSANLTFEEDGISIHGVNAKRIEVQSQSWSKPSNKAISVYFQENRDVEENVVTLSAISPEYSTSINFIDSTLLVKYVGYMISISPDFRHVTIYGNSYTYEFFSKNSKSSLQINFANDFITVLDDTDEITTVISADQITMHTQNISNTYIDCGNGSVLLSGEPIQARRFTIRSLLLSVQLTGRGFLHADSTGSMIWINSTNQNVVLSATHQEVRISEKVLVLTIETSKEIIKIMNANELVTPVWEFPSIEKPKSDWQLYGPFEELPNNFFSVFPNPQNINYTVYGNECTPRVLINSSQYLTTSTAASIAPEIDETNTSSIPDYATDSTETSTIQSSVLHTTQQISTSESGLSSGTHNPLYPEETSVSNIRSTVPYSVPSLQTTIDFSKFSTQKVPDTFVTESTPVATTNNPTSLDSTTVGFQLFETTSSPSASTIEYIDVFPEPSMLVTDDFVIGHWYTTYRPTEDVFWSKIQGIAVTVSLDKVESPSTTTPAADESPQPSSLNLNSNSAEKHQSKFLMLKLIFPDGVDVESLGFPYNKSFI